MTMKYRDAEIWYEKFEDNWWVEIDGKRVYSDMDINLCKLFVDKKAQQNDQTHSKP